MPSRRGFLIGLLAAGLAPRASWADLGYPSWLSAGRDIDGRYVVAGLSHEGAELFRCPLPERGHAIGAHPSRPEVIAFARRPGRFADVIDCRSGQRLARLTPPEGHHFYGHGVFSTDGTLLFTTENDYENVRGVIGVWDARDGYHRLRSLSSNGIGPHDLLLRQDASGLVVANGGIETHPESGRAKLNLPTMQPNLSYLSLDGDVQETLELPHKLRLASIRHLAARADGQVAFAMQWQGDLGTAAPIVGLHRPAAEAVLMDTFDARLRHLNGYGGSICFDATGARVAVTSPRGGTLQILDATTAQILESHSFPDVCGLAATQTGFAATAGTGEILEVANGKLTQISTSDLAWDNHLLALG